MITFTTKSKKLIEVLILSYLNNFFNKIKIRTKLFIDINVANDCFNKNKLNL
jgi:hypothetical protein